MPKSINIIKHDANKAFLYGVQYSTYHPDTDYGDTLEEMSTLKSTMKTNLKSRTIYRPADFPAFIYECKVSESLDYLDSLPMDIQRNASLEI